MAGGVRDFFQSVPPEDFKWNSPYPTLGNVHLILAGGGWVEIAINSKFFIDPTSQARNLHRPPHVIQKFT